MLSSEIVEAQAYREAMSRFAGHVHVATTDGVAGRRGVTIIAACSVSDAPPMVLVCLNRMKSDNDCFAENGVFALNTLSAGQVEIANAFSGLTGLTQDDRFALGSWSTLSTGSPVLEGAQAVFDCRVVEAKDMASHRVLFGKVTGLRIGDSVDPLIYHHRQYRTL